LTFVQRIKIQHACNISVGQNKNYREFYDNKIFTQSQYFNMRPLTMNKMEFNYKHFLWNERLNTLVQ